MLAVKHLVLSEVRLRQRSSKNKCCYQLAAGVSSNALCQPVTSVSNICIWFFFKRSITFHDKH